MIGHVVNSACSDDDDNHDDVQDPTPDEPVKKISNYKVNDKDIEKPVKAITAKGSKNPKDKKVRFSIICIW